MTLSPSSQNIKVLLIEDNPTDYHLTAKVFHVLQKDKFIQLDWCKSYEEGIKSLEKKAHDIYMIDYSLGAKTGLDLVEESYKKKIVDGPFVLLTDFEASALYERSAELGVYDHVLKRELSPSVLDRTITYAIRRFRTEQALKSEKEFNSFILAEIPYLVISVDSEGLIATVNPAVGALLGVSEKELIKTPWKEILHEEDRENIKYKMNDSGEVFFETRMVAKNGGERVINWNILNKSVARDGADQQAAFILSGKDVTDQIKAEENERRRQKMEALGQLAGGVAHEINNLLQPILMSSQMVVSKIEKDPENENASYFLKNMARIERNAKCAAKIVDDILLFSRGDQKETERLNVHSVIQDAITFVRDMLPATIGVASDLKEDMQGFDADINHNEMVQIITNMLINAAHAMEQKGEIVVTAQSDIISAERGHQMKLKPGQFIEIQIIDQGYGISEENMAQIFNPFFTTKDVGEGTGLGLSIVYKIIEKWGGTIKVNSTLGEGTTFSLYIPVL